MKTGRQHEPRIVDIYTHKRQRVGLRVAAFYLGISERALIARYEEGLIDAVHDKRVWLFTLAELIRYDDTRRRLAS